MVFINKYVIYKKPTILKMLCRGEYMWKFLYLKVMRGKWKKGKTWLFASWQGYSNKLIKHKMVRIAS